MPLRNRDAAGLAPRRVLLPIRLGMYQAGDAVFVGPPSILSNPFQRAGIGQARSVIFYRAWANDEMTPGVLRAARFSEAEIIALERRRPIFLKAIRQARGRNVRCSCPPWEPWCHGDVVINLANHRSRA